MFVEIVAGLFIIAVTIKLSVILGKNKCESKVEMTGKVVIVTGANSGLGFETAKDLASRGARIILACRNETRALAARDLIVKETGNTNLVYVNLDLTSLKSVRHFAEHINKTEARLDVLINNAGAHGTADKYTDDGIIEDMQINYFGPFLLTLLLLPLLKKTGTSRIVNLSSIAHFFGRVNLDHINKEYWHFWTYSNSKLCMVLFTVELARRLEGSGVTVNAVHPGVSKTNIVAKSDLISRLFFVIICWASARSVVEGAQTIIHLAVADECKNTSGKYFVDCKERYMSWKARDTKLTAALWKYSLKLVGYDN